MPEQAEFVGNTYTVKGDYIDSGVYTWTNTTHPLRTSGEHITALETEVRKLADRLRALEITVHMLLNPDGGNDGD